MKNEFFPSVSTCKQEWLWNILMKPSNVEHFLWKLAYSNPSVKIESEALLMSLRDRGCLEDLY